MIRIIRKRLVVDLNQAGFLFKNKRYTRKLDPGIFKIWDLTNRTDLIVLPLTERQSVVVNQEVLTRDNVALRFSFLIAYKIVDGKQFLTRFQVEPNLYQLLLKADEIVANLFQLRARKLISQIESEELNEKRNEIENFKSAEIDGELETYGIQATKAEVRDLTFPKNIQDLFTRQLESKIRSKTDLENARTAVATARALRNAADLAKGDDTIRFFQYLETITKIASKGKHTFMIGEIPKMGNER